MVLAQVEESLEYRQHASNTQMMSTEKNVDLRFCAGDKCKKQAMDSSYNTLLKNT